MFVGLADNPIITSLKKTEKGKFDWLGGMAADFLGWAPGQPAKDSGDCGGILKGLLSSVSCKAQNNFMCEAKKLEK